MNFKIDLDKFKTEFKDYLIIRMLEYSYNNERSSRNVS